jgi:hypothetical protein
MLIGSAEREEAYHAKYKYFVWVLGADISKQSKNISNKLLKK